MQQFQVDSLKDHGECFEKVVDWMCQYWGNRRNPNRNFWTCWIRHSMIQGSVPSTYTVMAGDAMIATFSLWRCDLLSRQDLQPWFGGFVIDPAWRGQGYGKPIITQACRMAHSMGHDEIYLNTTMRDYYEKSGFHYLGDSPDEDGSMVRVYRRALRG